jgi:hypothetical protein
VPVLLGQLPLAPLRLAGRLGPSKGRGPGVAGGVAARAYMPEGERRTWGKLVGVAAVRWGERRTTACGCHPHLLLDGDRGGCALH